MRQKLNIYYKIKEKLLQVLSQKTLLKTAGDYLQSYPKGTLHEDLVMQHWQFSGNYATLHPTMFASS